MNTITIVLSAATPPSLLDALAVLNEKGVSDDTCLEFDFLVSGAVTVTAKPEAPHKGVKQRCRAKDAQGRRCVRGPRHAENHRYENGE